MTALLVLQAVSIALTLAVLALEVPHRRRRRRHDLLRAFADEGLALAAGHRGLGHGADMTKYDAHQMAVEWARERALEHRLKVSPNEMSKIVALRRAKA